MDYNTPLLSVIVPVYGVEEYLDQCIESICNQKYNNLDIILVDDGSIGKERFICDSWADRDCRIRVLHKKNEGLVSARKAGISIAYSEYVTFVDGDDFIADDYYEKMMRHIVSQKPDLVCVSFSQYYPDKIEETIQNMPSGLYFADDLKKFRENMNCKDNHFYDFSIFPSTCLKIYRKTLLLEDCMGIPNDINLGEDSAMTFPYIFRCKKVVVDNSITGYYYRYSGNSMTKKVDDCIIRKADLLYDYLRPYYYNTNEKQIIIQLELYRAYLAETILNKYMSNVKYRNVDSAVKHIKQIVIDSSLYNLDCNELNQYGLPKEFVKKATYIVKSDWRGFCFSWKKELVLSCLYSMARKVLKKQ